MGLVIPLPLSDSAETPVLEYQSSSHIFIENFVTHETTDLTVATHSRRRINNRVTTSALLVTEIGKC